MVPVGPRLLISIQDPARELKASNAPLHMTWCLAECTQSETLYLSPCPQDVSARGGPEQGLGLLLLERFEFQPSPAQLEYCESPNACNAQVLGVCLFHEDTGRFVFPHTFLTRLSAGVLQVLRRVVLQW